MAFSLIGDDTCQFIAPTPLPDPYWIAVSPAAAELVGIALGSNHLPQDPDWLAVLAGNSLEADGHQFLKPMATAYSGHQFGHWAGHCCANRNFLCCWPQFFLWPGACVLFA